MVDTRNLNAPRYGSSPRSGAGPRFSRPSRDSEPTNPQAREKLREQAEREARAERDREAYEAHMAAAAFAGDPGARLRMESAHADAQLRSQLRRSGITAPGDKKPPVRIQMTGLQRAYGGYMALSCFDSLRGGMTAANLIQAVSTATTLMLLSKTFRQQVGDGYNTLRDGLADRIRTAPVRKWGEQAHAMEKDYNRLGLSRDEMPPVWQDRLNKVEFAERGGREAYTVHTAAAAEVGLIESAYLEARRPGADVSEVEQSFQTARGELYRMANEDGLQTEDISQRMRMMVGVRCDTDPRFAQVIDGVSQGRYVKAPPREVIDPEGRPRMMWMGDYEDRWVKGEPPIIDQGSFSPRFPLSPAEHAEDLRDAIKAGFDAAVGYDRDNPNVAGLHSAMGDYLVGVETGVYPQVPDYVENADTAQRLNMSRNFFGAAHADGIDPNLARTLYAQSYVGAVQELMADNPELNEKWTERYGQNWAQEMRERMSAYDTFGADLADEHRTEPEEQVFTAYSPSQDQAQPESSSGPTVEDADYVAHENFDSQVWEGRTTTELFEAMSNHIGSDLLHAHEQNSVYGQSDGVFVASSTYRHVEWSKNPATLDFLSQQEQVRLQSAVQMREALGAVGVTDTDAQDIVLGAAYVRGLEKAARVDADFHQQLRDDVSMRHDPDNWREQAFALSQQKASPESYRAVVTQLGLDPDRYREDLFEREVSDENSPQGQARKEKQDEMFRPAKAPRRKLWAWMRPPVPQAQRHLRVEVNQQYNQYDKQTDRFFGIGADSAPILQDSGFELE